MIFSAALLFLRNLLIGNKAPCTIKKPEGRFPQATRRTRGIANRIELLWANLFLHEAIVRNLCKFRAQGRSSDLGIFTVFQPSQVIPSDAGLTKTLQEIRLLLYSGVTVWAFHSAFLFSRILCRHLCTFNSGFIVAYTGFLSIGINHCTGKNSMLRWEKIEWR